MYEDFILFEAACLLKEKRFKWFVNHYYNKYENFNNTYETWENYNDLAGELMISAPTLYVAQKWLREQHNIHIEICMAEQRDYYISLVIIDKNNNFKLTTCKDYYNTYEEALGAGIIEALRLI